MKFLAQILAVALLVTASAQMAFADPVKGQRLFIKVLKKPIGKTGGEISKEHTAAEWEALFANDGAGFVKEYSEKYPEAAKKLQSQKVRKYMNDLKDFMIKYASDSGNVPSC